MKYCRECSSEYFDDKDRCPECDCELVSQQQWEEILEEKQAEDSMEFVKVKIVENQFEADIIKGVLENEGVPVMVRSFHDTSFDGIFESQKGWGVILVPDGKKEKALIVIEQLKDSDKVDG
jgi:hypothetical protein